MESLLFAFREQAYYWGKCFTKLRVHADGDSKVFIKTLNRHFGQNIFGQNIR